MIIFPALFFIKNWTILFNGEKNNAILIPIIVIIQNEIKLRASIYSDQWRATGSGIDKDILNKCLGTYNFS